MRTWVREARQAKGLSEKNVADEVGISQPADHWIEVGEKNPRPETAKKIGAVLGIPWVRFYEDEEESAE